MGYVLLLLPLIKVRVMFDCREEGSCGCVCLAVKGADHTYLCLHIIIIVWHWHTVWWSFPDNMELGPQRSS